MNNYFELKISINPDIEEIVSDICFSNFDCEGVVLAEEAWKDLEMTSTTRGTLRVFLTDLNNNPIEVLKTERELLKSRGFTDEELGSWEIELDEKENQDWSKKWKEKWTVTHVTENIAVVPSWLSYEPKENEITITLDPGCAFGTGTHQTTQLCMKAMEKYLNKGDTMADIGTGSGILAICALKMGAKSAYGCDNDETVIDVCYENAVKNGMSIDTPPPNPLPQGAGEHDECSVSHLHLPQGLGEHDECSASYLHLSQGLGETQYPPREGGSKSSISGWGNAIQHKYPSYLKENAKELRNNATKQERKLWQYLRKSLLGYKFRRQQPLGRYIVDFYCPELKLVIELDGGQHNQENNKNYDKKRDEFIQKQGCSIIRIWNNDIDNNIDGVVEYIKQTIDKLTPPPNPLPQGLGEHDECSASHLPLSQGLGETQYPPREGGSKSSISGWGNSLTFELKTADKLTEKYDFVCANILHNVLSVIMGDLKNIMKPQAKMVLSGILDEKKSVVLEAIEREDLKIVETIYQDQWVAYVVEK